MRSLRIVQTPVRPFPHTGGVELHVHNVANRLIKKGHKVTIIAAKIPELRVKGISYKQHLLNWSFKITNTEITFSLPYTLYKISFDVIHSHIPTPWTSDWSMIIGSIKRKKKVITIHNDMYKEGFFAQLITRIYVETAMKLTLYLADRIIIVNEDWEKSFRFTRHILRAYKNKILHIPNAVDTVIFSKVAKKVPHRLLCVSVLDKYHVFKGIPYLLQAFVDVLRKYPDATLQIVGEGELKYEYIALSKKLNIIDSLIFSGEATQDDLATYYSQAELFILPSVDTEGFGLVLLESLACGTPVIATSVAGVANDILKNDCGTIVPIRNSQSISKAVSMYFDQPDLIKTHIKNGVSLIQSKYSWDKVTNEIEKLYFSVL